MEKPKVSVLMAVYNGEKYLRQSISSILEQTFSNFEFIIINDNSTDNSLSIIQSYSDKRIRLINNPQNVGVARSVNKGINLSQGEYIARMDCDDICLPGRLEKEVKLLDTTPGIVMVSANVVLIDTKGSEIGYWNENIQAKSGEDIYHALPFENWIANPTVLIRSSVLKRYNYNESQKHSEDWDLWLRLASAGEKFSKINEVLVKYRIHDQSVTVKSNRAGVYRVKSEVQLRFCLYEIKHFRFNRFVIKVLKNCYGNYSKSLFQTYPNAIRGIRKVFNTSIIGLFGQLFSVISFYFSTSDTSVFFFFPFYHVGGAEKVHAQILQSIADKKPVVFITGISSGKGFYEQFKQSANVIEIGLIAEYPRLHKLVKILLLGRMRRTVNPVVFGCNSAFYYHFIPYLSPNIKCVDLVHAFVGYNEPGPEYWSLPVVERIDKRVVINKKTIEDFRSLYTKNNKDIKFVDRIEYIPNYITKPESSIKPSDEKLNIIYVGRDSPEKRVYLTGKIAHKVSDSKVNAEFTLVGNLYNALYNSDTKYCKITGEISSDLEMQSMYHQAHILILTSLREGFPMVIMEAMANEVVVITTDVGGISEHIKNNETGILIKEHEEDPIVDGFVTTIINLSNDKSKLNRLSKNAYAYAEANFFNKMQFVDAYRKLFLTNKNR